jgi:ABC-type Fe3+ transport system substrate-binding protein
MTTHRAGAGRLPYLIVLALAFAVVLGAPLVLHVRQEQPAAAEGAPAAGNLPQKTLTIVSVHPDTVRNEFERAFTRWTARTQGYAVKIDWLDLGGTTQATKAILDLYKQTPQGVGIDLFFGGGVDPYLELARRDLLEPVDVPADVLDRIPQSFSGMDIYDRQHRWFGAALSGFGIIFNRPVLQKLGLPEPYEWADLGRPDYLTWVAAADPRQSGSMHAMYEIILQAYGWDKGWQVVASMGANCRGFTNQASDVPKDVSTGEAAAGMAIDFYALQAVAEVGDNRLEFRLPNKLTVVTPDAMGVLKGAPHAALAKLFVQFVLSEEAQKLWILKPGTPGGPSRYLLARLSVIPGLTQKYKDTAFVHLDPFAFSGITLDSDLTSRRWRILNDLLGACIIDVQGQLADAWRVLRKLPADDPRRVELFKPFVSEKELMDLSGKPWDDPAVRAKTISRWAAEASARYRRLKEAY